MIVEQGEKAVYAQEVLEPEREVSEPATTRRAKVVGIQSVDRALTLLELMAQIGGDVPLSELAIRSGLNVSTCHHILATLVARGYAAKRSGRRYGLGSRVLLFTQAYSRQVDLPGKAAPLLDRLNLSTGETVQLAVLQGLDLVTLSKRDARHAVRVDSSSVGTSDAAHATATGKAILAWLPEAEMKRILEAKGMRAFTQKTITESAALVEALRIVRRQGFALDEEEFQQHVICVGAAIRDHAGGVIGAISASTPMFRADAKHLDFVRSEVIAAARSLSDELGGPQAGSSS